MWFYHERSFFYVGEGHTGETVAGLLSSLYFAISAISENTCEKRKGGLAWPCEGPWRSRAEPLPSVLWSPYICCAEM